MVVNRQAPFIPLAVGKVHSLVDHTGMLIAVSRVGIVGLNFAINLIMIRSFLLLLSLLHSFCDHWVVSNFCLFAIPIVNLCIARIISLSATSEVSK